MYNEFKIISNFCGEEQRTYPYNNKTVLAIRFDNYNEAITTMIELVIHLVEEESECISQLSSMRLIGCGLETLLVIPFINDKCEDWGRIEKELYK